MNLGEKIKTLRKKYKVKQSTLADALGVSTQMIVNYENETRAISIEKLKQISDFFSIPVYFFFLDNFDKALNSDESITEIGNKIPIISKASAGSGVSAVDYANNYIEVPPKMFKECDFATLVEGDSMSPRIEDGELVFVKKTHMLETGNIGIFYLNDEVFVKKFYHDPLTETTKLISFNRQYPDIIIEENDDFRIIGRVIGSLDYQL